MSDAWDHGRMASILFRDSMGDKEEREGSGRLVAMGPTAEAAARAAKNFAKGPSGTIAGTGGSVVEGLARYYEGKRALAQHDFEFYKQDPERQHIYEPFNHVDWLKYGNTFDEAWRNLLNSGDSNSGENKEKP